MEKAINLLQSAIDEIRKLSKRLSASFDTEMDLEDAVKELVETVSTANKLGITIHTDLSKTKSRSPEVELAIYRILQEHLTNVTKHAGASHVEVTLRQSEEELTLVVTDDGKGFDPGQKAEGVGLANMRSRAESLAGVFNIESQPGKGTTLFVQLPLVPQ